MDLNLYLYRYRYRCGGRPDRPALFAIATALLPLLACSRTVAAPENVTVAAAPDSVPATVASSSPGATAQTAATAAMPAGAFTNPIIHSRDTADPWIVDWKGAYYFTFTAGGSVEIWKSPTLTGFDNGQKVTVWRAHQSGPESRDIWAPELHRLRGRWYVYYTGSDGTDDGRRQYVLESDGDDPTGPYHEKGQLAAPGADCYAIDGTAFETPHGALYYVWSGRIPEHGGAPQNIFIAPMSNPWTISGPRVLLSSPQLDWERHGWPVDEGPEVLQHGGKTFIVYSASGGTTPDYCLGLLTNSSGDLLNPDAWKKSPQPVFQKYVGPDGVVYTPGHNGFCLSPDGHEDWIVYHAKDNTDGTWGGRTARAQRFLWTADGTPFFGHPVPPGVRLARPSGDTGAPAATASAGGDGTGLTVAYFGTITPDGMPQQTRLDPFIGFERTEGAPASVRWTGALAPRYTETYTLQTYSAGGVRVWLDGKPIIADWAEHPLTADQADVPLVAGRRYAIRVEYRTGRPVSELMLAWNSSHQPFEIIPADRLYPTNAPQAADRGDSRSTVTHRSAKRHTMEVSR